MSKKAEVKKKIKKPFDYSKSIVAVEKDSWGCYETTFFKDQNDLLKSVSEGNFSVKEKTKFFSLSGVEVKVSVTVEKVPVYQDKKIAKIAA